MAAPSGHAQAATAVEGAWVAQETYYRATLLFERDEAGTLQAFFVSDDRGRSAPMTSAAVRGDSVFFEADDVVVAFRGAFSADGPTIRGTYTQGERSVSLTLVPASGASAQAVSAPVAPAVRSLDSVRPDLYVAEDTVFQTESPGVQLAGTLTLPSGPGPHPAVVLVAGTGDNDRDFEIYGHRPFLVLADFLTRRGIAVLRYDERGVGGSNGDPHTTRFDEEARDVAAAVRVLRGRPEIDATRVGIVGHSVGGAYAPYVHARLERAAFLVLLMAPAAPLEGLLAEQPARMAAAYGAPDDEVATARAYGAALTRAVSADTDSLTAAAAVGAAAEAAGLSAEMRDAIVQANTSRGYRDLVRYDPGPDLSRIDVPVLAVYGRSDLAVTAKENAAPMAVALATSASPDASVRVLGTLNHYLQTSTTGLEDEAAAAETSIHPALLNAVTDWIIAKTLVGR